MKQKNNKVFQEILTPDIIDKWADIITEYLIKLKIEKTNRIRYRYSIEECLLNWMDHFGEGTEVTLRFGRRLSSPTIQLELAGKPYNPFAASEDEYGTFGNSILKQIGLSPEYTYKKKRNVVCFRVKGSSKSTFVPLIIATISAVIVSAAGYLFTDAFRSSLLTIIFDPIYDIFMATLSCIAGPMIFLSVAWGIYGFGDVDTLNKIGRKLLIAFVVITFLFTMGAFLLALPFFELRYIGTSSSGGQIASIVEMIKGYFPSDIVSPFAEGNTLQIILMAVVVGIALLFLGKQTESLAHAVEQINYMIQFLMEFISRLIPYFIFVVIVRLVWMGTAEILLQVWKLIAIFLGASILMLLLYTCYTGIRQQVNPLLIIKKSMRSFIIALTTASSSAAFGSVMNTCEKKLGINHNLANFGIPLGTVISMPTMAVFDMSVIMFCAEFYHISVSATWFITGIFICCILAIATPPIPGGAITAYTILFLQMGIPDDALAIILAVDIFVDFLITGFDTYINPIILINHSSNLGMLDKTMLRKK